MCKDLFHCFCSSTGDAKDIMSQYSNARKTNPNRQVFDDLFCFRLLTDDTRA